MTARSSDLPIAITVLGIGIATIGIAWGLSTAPDTPLRPTSFSARTESLLFTELTHEGLDGRTSRPRELRTDYSVEWSIRMTVPSGVIAGVPFVATIDVTIEHATITTYSRDSDAPFDSKDGERKWRLEEDPGRLESRRTLGRATLDPTGMRLLKEAPFGPVRVDFSLKALDTCRITPTGPNTLLDDGKRSWCVVPSGAADIPLYLTPLVTTSTQIEGDPERGESMRVVLPDKTRLQCEFSVPVATPSAKVKRWTAFAAALVGAALTVLGWMTIVRRRREGRAHV